jgi:coenzyme F420-reducing hydrogenase beta subunit
MKTWIPKSCSSCRYWLPRVSDVTLGACNAPLPVSQWGVILRRTMEDTQGKNCPAWRKRIVRKRKLASVAPIGRVISVNRDADGVKAVIEPLPGFPELPLP